MRQAILDHFLTQSEDSSNTHGQKGAGGCALPAEGAVFLPIWMCVDDNLFGILVFKSMLCL